MGKCGSHFDLLNLEAVNPITTGFIRLKPASTKRAKSRKLVVTKRVSPPQTQRRAKGDPIPFGPFANLQGRQTDSMVVRLKAPTAACLPNNGTTELSQNEYMALEQELHQYNMNFDDSPNLNIVKSAYQQKRAQTKSHKKRTQPETVLEKTNECEEEQIKISKNNPSIFMT
jgi:hypothetical protein